MTPITMSRQAKGFTVEFIRRLKDIATSSFFPNLLFYLIPQLQESREAWPAEATSAWRGPRGREFAFPAGDDHAGDAISENGHSRSSHIHKLIDGEKVKRSGRAEDDQQRGARHARGPFAADQQRQDHHELLPDGRVQSRGLDDKKQCQGLIKAGAVHIEAVARGENEGDDFARHAKGLQFSM